MVDQMVAMVPINKSGNRVKGQAFPILSAVCKQCSFVLSVNAKRVGLL